MRYIQDILVERNTRYTEKFEAQNLTNAAFSLAFDKLRDEIIRWRSDIQTRENSYITIKEHVPYEQRLRRIESQLSLSCGISSGQKTVWALIVTGITISIAAISVIGGSTTTKNMEIASQNFKYLQEIQKKSQEIIKIFENKECKP